jgi:hypothetical protein
MAGSKRFLRPCLHPPRRRPPHRASAQDYMSLFRKGRRLIPPRPTPLIPKDTPQTSSLRRMFFGI